MHMEHIKYSQQKHIWITVTLIFNEVSKGVCTSEANLIVSAHWKQIFDLFVQVDYI